MEREYIDVWLSEGDEERFIELKYKTRRLATTVNGEDYNLLAHSANDVSRYDFWKDVERLERVVKERPRAAAYTVFLTNDHLYWQDTRRLTCDAEFRIHDGRQVSKQNLCWGDRAGAGTTKKRERRLCLNGTYLLTWHDYSTAAQSSSGRFRYIAVPIGL